MLLLLLIVTLAVVCVSSNSNSNSDINTFITWFTTNGGVLNGVSIAEFDGMGRGVLASRDISEDELIIVVPSKLIFSKRSMIQSIDSIHKDIMSLYIYQSSNPDDAIVACLLTEKYRGDSSFYAPYIKLLPNYVPNLSRFSDEELIDLQDSIFEEQVQYNKKQKLTSYNTFLQIISKLWTKYNINVDPVNVSFDDYLWACSILDSRGLRFQGQVHLAPFADMFNYQPHSSQREFDSGNFFLEHHRISEDTGSLTILADQSQDKSMQLFEDYGDNSDQIYLQYHGFVPDINPFRCVNLKTIGLDNSNDEYTRVFLGKVFGRGIENCVTSNGKLSSPMEVYLSISLMNEAETNKCTDIINKEYNRNKSKERIKSKEIFSVFEIITQRCARKTINLLNNVKENGASKYANNDNYKKLLDVLNRLITQSKPDYSTTIEEDEVLLSNLMKDDKSNAHRMLAVRYRLFTKKMWQIVTSIYGSTSNASLSDAINIPTLSDLDVKLNLFNEWFASTQPIVNKLKAISMPIYRIGTISTDAIKSEDDYLAVPTKIIMDSEAAESDMNGVGVLLKSLYELYKSSDDFHGLLFFLIYERFINMEKSSYWPYLQLLPLTHELDIPLLWTDEETKIRLKPSSTLQPTLDYRAHVKNMYEKILSIDLVKSFFPADIFTFENYRWATAILDSRSIWWSGKRHLVPMLDFINCIEGPEGSRVHSTALDDTGKYALTKSPWSFNKGEQVFENYGQPNHIYYTYHGFILRSNKHDCVSFELSMTTEEVQRINWNDDRIRGIANYIRLSKSAGISSCLAYPIPDKVWLYLSLKNNIIDDNSDKPNSQNAKTLSMIIEKHLSNYNDYNNDNHTSSEQFIKSEEKLLNDINNKLQNENKIKDEL